MSGAFFGAIMVISRCCKDMVYPLVDYYVCGNCHFPCGTLDSSILLRDYADDTGREAKTKSIVGAA